MARKTKRLLRFVGNSNKLLLSIILASIVATGGVFASFIITPDDASLINLEDGLIGWWKFDGNTNDSSGLGYNATNVGGASLTTDRFGNPNSAYDFSGSGQYMSTTNNLLPDKFSVSAWFYEEGSSGAARFIASNSRDCCDNTKRGWNIASSYTGLNLTGGLWRSNGTGGLYATTASNTTPTNTWAHVALTYDGNVLRLYLDGVQVSSDTYSQSTNGTPTYNLYIGRLGYITGFEFNGKIDDFRYYDRVINSLELDALVNGLPPDPNFNVTIGKAQANQSGHYKMNGNAKDESPNGLDATVTSATLTTDRMGQANKAYTFNGSSAYISVPSGAFGSYPTSGNTSSYGLSISLWYKTSTTPAAILGQTSGTAPPSAPSGYVPAIYVGTDGKLRSSAFWHNSTTALITSTGTNFADGNWHHVVVTYSAGVETLYADGALIGTQTLNQYGYSGTYSYFLGAQYSNTGWTNSGGSTSWKYLNGQMDDVKFYDQALTSAEVTKLFTTYDGDITVAQLSKGLVGYWPFNGSLKDETPFSNHGTITGTITLTTDRLGQANKAYNFNGGHISTTNQMELNNFTISAWIYPTNVTYLRVVASNARNCCDSSARGFSLSSHFISNEPNISITQNDGLGYHGASGVSTDFPINTWNLITATYDGTNIRLYKNGTQIASNTYTQSFMGTPNVGLKFGVMATDTNQGPFYGTMDDVRLYNRALTQPEIAKLLEFYN